MKSPLEQKIIQIEITNACFNQCSNCTRFSGHHKKTYFMDFCTFKKAVESLHDYPGMVGIIGGEPTLHPSFDKFIRYYSQIIARLTPRISDVEPVYNLQKWVKSWGFLDGRRRGLWTSLGPGYAKHYELISSIFEYQCINDHNSEGLHQSLLITRKELGIKDEEFFRLRDSCWIQNLWSSAITYKGAFFCEVAAALDMLLDGPGGWPLERGWWRRKPADFGDQLNWCELCGGCLKVPSIPAKNEVDIVSPEWKKRLESIGSKKKTIVFDVTNYVESKYKLNSNIEPYLSKKEGSTRASKENIDCLTLSKINVALVSVGYSKLLEKTLKYNIQRADSITVVTEKQDLETIRVAESYGANVVLSDKKNLNGAVFNKGAMLNDAIRFILKKTNHPWILLIDADVILSVKFKESVAGLILNPGVLYFAERVNISAAAIELCINDQEKLNSMPINRAHDSADCNAWGYFQLFNTQASIFSFMPEGPEKWYSEEFYSAGYVDMEFMKRWGSRKACITRCTHISHGQYAENWYGIKYENNPIGTSSDKPIIIKSTGLPSNPVVKQKSCLEGFIDRKIESWV